MIEGFSKEEVKAALKKVQDRKISYLAGLESDFENKKAVREAEDADTKMNLADQGVVIRRLITQGQWDELYKVLKEDYREDDFRKGLRDLRASKPTPSADLTSVRSAIAAIDDAVVLVMGYGGPQEKFISATGLRTLGVDKYLKLA